MAIVKQIHYVCVCDECGRDYGWTMFPSISEAKLELGQAGWKTVKGRLLCVPCGMVVK